MWKQHIAICATLALLAIPLYIADRYLTKCGGGGWISLDFSGVIIIPYIAFVAVHIAVSSLILAVSPNVRLLPLHLSSGILTIGLLVVGLLTYSARQRSRDAANYEKRDEIIQQLRNAIELREWWYEPSDEALKEIHVRVKVHESARVSGIIFEDKPSSPYDGHFIREQIPPRTPR
jgi:hypothetical protein